MFVKNEAKVTSRVSGVKRRVMYFSKLLSSKIPRSVWSCRPRCYSSNSEL